MDYHNPQELLDAYNNGLQGATYDPKDMAELLAQLPNPLFGDIGQNLFGTGKGALCLPYKAVQYFFPKFGEDEAQTTGDCVSHATRNAVDVTRCYEIVYKKEKEVFVARGATEPIYGSRGHGGQGMQCSQAARFVGVTGGFLLRENYTDIGVDLSKYNSKIGANWGSRGVPQNLIDKASNYRISNVTTIESVEEARDLLANGYGLTVCSNVGFSNVRDKYGISEPSGSWAHAMAWIAVDDTHERLNETLFLVQNSWGLWNSGPKYYDQPEGSFWIRQSVAANMIAAGGAFAFADFKGFTRKADWTKIMETF